MGDVSGTRGPTSPRPDLEPKIAVPPPHPRNFDIHSADGTSPSNRFAHAPHLGGRRRGRGGEGR
eukprot:6714676-Pyramimonas_sp.AAC.1